MAIIRFPKWKTVLVYLELLTWGGGGAATWRWPIFLKKLKTFKLSWIKSAHVRLVPGTRRRRRWERCYGRRGGVSSDTPEGTRRPRPFWSWWPWGRSPLASAGAPWGRRARTSPRRSSERCRTPCRSPPEKDQVRKKSLVQNLPTHKNRLAKETKLEREARPRNYYNSGQPKTQPLEPARSCQPWP